MDFAGIDPDGARTLSQAMRLSSDRSEDTGAEVTAALTLSELDSPTTGELTDVSVELDRIAIVLQARVDLVEGFVIDIPELAAALAVTEQAAVEAIAAATGTADDPATADDTPLLDLAIRPNLVFVESPTSIRDLLLGLPRPGENPRLDEAIENLDGPLMEAFDGDRGISEGELSKDQLNDLKVLTAALGGNKLTVSRTRREKYSGAQGDDEYRNVTEDITIVDAGTATMLRYVGSRLGQDRSQREVTNELLQITEDLDRSDLAGAAAELGVTERELEVLVGTADLLAITVDRDGRDPIAGATGDTETGTAPADFPERGDFPAGAVGDQDYIQAVELDRLAAYERGQNVVGPVGSEQDAFYEAIGSLFGAQNFAFSHDIQATQAEIENLNDPGLLGVDFPNAVTATLGYAATAVSAPVIAGINKVFDTNIDIAVVGTALADGLWSAFGYDVDGPTVAEAKARRHAERFPNAGGDPSKDRDENGNGSNSLTETPDSGTYSGSDDGNDGSYGDIPDGISGSAG